MQSNCAVSCGEGSGWVRGDQELAVTVIQERGDGGPDQV